MSDQLTKVAESAFERGIERYAEMLFSERRRTKCLCKRACASTPRGYLQLLDLAERAMRACVGSPGMRRAGTNPCRCPL